MKGIRWETRHGYRYIKRSDIKKLLYNPLGTIQDGQGDIGHYLEKQPELKQMLELVYDFKKLLLGKDERKLEGWMKRAEKLQVAEIDSFLKLIRSDMEAVKNAIRYPLSD